MTCLGNTPSGRPCRKKIVDGETRCRVHLLEYVTGPLHSTMRHYKQLRRQQEQERQTELRTDHVRTHCSFIDANGSWCHADRPSNNNMCEKHRIAEQDRQRAAAENARVAAEAADMARQHLIDEAHRLNQLIAQQAQEDARFRAFMNGALPGLTQFIRDEIHQALANYDFNNN